MPGAPNLHHHDAAIVGAGLSGLVAVMSDVAPERRAVVAEAVLAAPA